MKNLNTQMASWTELRHDTLLYAKPTYTDPGLCVYPDGYVEPRLEFLLSDEADRAGPGRPHRVAGGVHAVRRAGRDRERRPRWLSRGRGPQPDPAAGQMARNAQPNQPQPDSQTMRVPDPSSVLTLPTAKPPAPQYGAGGTSATPGGLRPATS